MPNSDLRVRVGHEAEPSPRRTFDLTDRWHAREIAQQESAEVTTSASAPPIVRNRW
jgi:hypothetical protein